jgi:hypothetical protein
VAIDTFTGLASGQSLTAWSANWTAYGTLVGQASGGRVRGGAAGNGVGRYVGTWADDQSVSVVVAFSGVVAGASGPAARMSAGFSGYVISVGETGLWYLGSLNFGSWGGTIASGDTGVSSPATIELHCQGTTISGKANGNTIFSLTDGTHAAGNPGIYTYYDTEDCYVDDFRSPWDDGVVEPELPRIIFPVQAVRF